MKLDFNLSRRRGQGAFEYILLLAGVLLIVVLAIIILKNSVLGNANTQIQNNTQAYSAQTCTTQYTNATTGLLSGWNGQQCCSQGFDSATLACCKNGLFPNNISNAQQQLGRAGGTCI